MIRRVRRPLLAAAMLVGAAATSLPRATQATVEEQRARLPPAASCPDRVEGEWVALKYEAQYGEWYDVAVVIRRSEPRPGGDDPGPIEAEMTSHYWHGGATDPKPPPCAPGRFEAIVKMPAKGAIDGAGNVEIGASTYRIERQLCGEMAGYNPDRFSGKIDPARQEFQSVNNDGGRYVNSPMVFRRVRCLDAARRGTTKAAPPALAPKKRSWSCAR